MQARVKLPSGPLVEFLAFTQAIAEAVCPTGEHGLEGIECVTGKLVPGNYPIPDTKQWGALLSDVAYQSELMSDDGRPLDQLITSEVQPVPSDLDQLSLGAGSPVPIHRFSYPFKLTDTDRNELLNVLPQLPPLRYPMSDDERDAFMDAYCNLPNKPMWLPTLVTDETVNRLKGVQHEVLMRHQRALREAHKVGQIASVSARHEPLAGMMAGTYIPIDQAIQYLVQHGLVCGDVVKGGDKSTVETPRDDSPQLIEPASPPSDEKVKAGGVGIRRAKQTPEQRKAVVARSKELKGQGDRAHTTRTAAEFGISDSRVRRLVREAEGGEGKTPTKVGRIDKLLAGKG